MLAPLIALALAAGPSAADRVQIFRAAGFRLKAGQWISKTCDGSESEPSISAYEPGKIKPLGDLNRDGRPEMLVTEGGEVCYGSARWGFVLLTRSANGRWMRIAEEFGFATFLKTRANGWPELEVGNRFYCYDVWRWTGTAFEYHRSQDKDEGKPC